MINNIYFNKFSGENRHWQKHFELYSKLSSHKKRIEDAKNYINNAFDEKKDWYVAWSGGKDSTVLAHMVNVLRPDTLVWSLKDDRDISFILNYLKSVAEIFNFNLQIDYTEAIKQNSIKRSDVSEKSNFDEFIDRDGNIYKTYQDYIDKKRNQISIWRGCFLGLRIEESKTRLFNYAKKGIFYKTKDNHIMCNPLSKLTGDDIFAYLITNNIPILDVYQRTMLAKNGDPRLIRYHDIIPRRYASEGFVSWLKYHYNDEYERLRSYFPSIQEYV